MIEDNAQYNHNDVQRPWIYMYVSGEISDKFYTKLFLCHYISLNVDFFVIAIDISHTTFKLLNCCQIIDFKHEIHYR